MIKNIAVRRFIKFFLLLIASIIFLLLFLYFFICIYYKNRFSYNTWINDYYCSGKTVNQINKLLLSKKNSDAIIIKSSYYPDETLYLSDFDCSFSYHDKLKNIIEKQRIYLWPLNKTDNVIVPSASFDRNKLSDLIMDMSFVKNSFSNDEADILYDETTGYYFNENLVNHVDVDALIAYISDNLCFESTINLPNSIFYYDDISSEIEEKRAVWDEVNDFLNTKIYFDMGDEIIPIDGSILSTFLVRDFSSGGFSKTEDGRFFISELAVSAFVDKLCDKYDTYKLPRVFITHLGDEKYIETSVYGTLIDRESEKEYLYNALINSNAEIHTPKYLVEPFSRGINDIGDTLVEVDMTKQVLYYICGGEVILTCDIVTGLPNGNYDTPEMIACLNKKVRSKYLRGPGYVSYVDYWMPIYNEKAIGLHDASWQKQFGGNRYLTNGSKGCINMRLEDAKTLFDAIEIGTPVIVYK